MRSFPSDAIRNVAFVGHAGSGKTTLVEALLAETGAIGRPGRVEDGTTVCDTEPEERARGRSLSLALAATEWRDHKLNLLDTPGAPDFEPEVESALRVADLAVFVVSGAEGVGAQIRRLWRLAGGLGLPRMIFVNKLDRDRSSFDGTLDALREAFGAGVAPLELPIGAEGAFHGVADLLSDTAFLYDGGTHTSGPIPEEMMDREHVVHDALVEGIVVGDDALLERYLGRRDPLGGGARGHPRGRRRRRHGLPGGVRLGHRADRRRPARRLPLRDRSLAARPSRRRGRGRRGHLARRPRPGRPAARRRLQRPPPTRSSARSRCSGSSRAPFAATSSCGTPGPAPTSASTACSPSAARSTSTSTRCPSATWRRWRSCPRPRTGDTLSAPGLPVTVPWPEPPEPMSTVAVAAATPADEDKLATALQRLLAEDPSLQLRRDDETHQTVLGGQGETHLAVTLERLTRKFGVEVTTEDVRIAHRETVTGAGRAEGRLKKQSGGHGQFAVVTLEVEPLERGAGFEFVDEIVGGAIPRQFVPAVEKGVAETMAEGGALGFPVVDIRVRCVDGKHHPVDSSEMAFKAAARLALRDALADAGPVVLEPVSWVEVTVPTDLQGEVHGRPHLPPGTGPGDRGGRRRGGGGHGARPRRRAHPLLGRPALADRAAGRSSAPATTTTTCCPPTSSPRSPTQRGVSRPAAAPARVACGRGPPRPVEAHPCRRGGGAALLPPALPGRAGADRRRREHRGAGGPRSGPTATRRWSSPPTPSAPGRCSSQALHQVLVADTPVIHPAVLDASQRHWEAPVVETVDSVLEQLGDGAGLARRRDRPDLAGASGTAGRPPPAAPRSVALDLVREAVRVGHDNLGAVERTLAALPRLTRVPLGPGVGRARAGVGQREPTMRSVWSRCS